MKFKKILSEGEFEVKKRITSASEQHDAELFSLIRVADVFEDLKGSGLSGEAVSFALKAHFDFVVCDRESRPLFVIEYDGAHHSSPEQARRDSLKDIRWIFAEMRKRTIRENQDLSELPGKKLSRHTLRVTFATELHKNGCDIRTINELLLHKKLGTTAKYVRVLDDDLQHVLRTAHPWP